MHPRPNLPFDKRKAGGSRDASAITRMLKAVAESADYNSKVGFTNYTLGSSSKAGFIWSINQQGLVNDYRNIISKSDGPADEPLAPAADITSFAINPANVELVWSGSESTISIYGTTSSDGSGGILLRSEPNQTEGTFTWSVELPVSPELYYYATVTNADDVTADSEIIQYNPENYGTPDVPGYDIFVIAGQSNGQGYPEDAVTPSSFTDAMFQLQADPHAEPEQVSSGVIPQNYTLYQTNGSPTTFTGSDPIHPYLSKPTGKSLAVNFAHAYATSANGYLRGTRRVLLVQTCIASVAFTKAPGLETDPNDRGWWQGTPGALGLATQNLIYKVSLALQKTYPGSEASNNRLVAFCWQEGESESDKTLAVAQEYKAKLTQFYSSAITGITGLLNSNGFTSDQVTNMLVTRTLLVGSMTPKAADGTLSGRPHGAVVTSRAQAINTNEFGISAVPRSAYVPTTGFPLPNREDVHFNNAELDIMSTNYMNVYNTIASANVPVSLAFTNASVQGNTFSVEWLNNIPGQVELRMFINVTDNSNTGGELVGSPITYDSGVGFHNFASLSFIPGEFLYATLTPTLAPSKMIVTDPIPTPTFQLAVSGTGVFTDISISPRTIAPFSLNSSPYSPNFIVSGRTGYDGTPRAVYSQTDPPSGSGIRALRISGSFPAGSYTKTCWVKFTAVNLYSHIFSSSQDGNGNLPLALLWTFNESMVQANNINIGAETDFNTTAKSSNLVVDRWYFIASVFDSTSEDYGTQRIYAYDPETGLTETASHDYPDEGGYNPGITPTGATASTYSLLIGAYKTDEVSFRGQIDDVRLYPAALTAEQIETIRTSV